MDDDWKEFFDFLDNVVGDSPHSCDPDTMEWFEEKLKQLKEITGTAND